MSQVTFSHSMLRRWIQLLLLASVAFWATGSAAYLHELIEHAHAPMAHAYRDSSQIQFTSQDFPPSSEKDCSIRAAFGDTSIQT